MTEEQVRAILKRAVEKSGTRAAFAREHNVHETQVYQAFHGFPVAKRLLDALGLERVVTYRKVSDSGK